MKLPQLDLSGLPVTYQQEIPDSYRDAFGHTNVMWYMHLFSRGFIKFGDQFGFNADYLTENQIGSFALEAHIRYLSEVLIGRHITIRTRLLGRSDKRIHFIHFMTIDETGVLAATQENVSAHIDMRVRRMSPFPASMAARIDEIIAQQNALGWEAPVCGSMRP